MDISEILEGVRQIESIDEIDLIFHAIIARQQELAAVDELWNKCFDRIDNRKAWDALHERYGVPFPSIPEE